MEAVLCEREEAGGIEARAGRLSSVATLLERLAERMTKTAGPRSVASSRDCSSIEPKSAMATWQGVALGCEVEVEARARVEDARVERCGLGWGEGEGEG